MRNVLRDVLSALGAVTIVGVLAMGGSTVPSEQASTPALSAAEHEHLVESMTLPFRAPELSSLTQDAILHYGDRRPDIEFNPLTIQVGYAPWSGPPMMCFSKENPPSQDVINAVNAAMLQFLAAGYQPGTRWSGTTGTPRNLTWSFVPDGTSIPASSGLTSSAAPSNLFSTMDSKFASAGGRAVWIAEFQAIFDRWSALTGLSYTRVTAAGVDWDDGAALHGSAGGATRGDLRISGRTLDGVNGVLAYNFFPSTGDMVVDTSESWQSSANSFRFLRNTLGHEHGHGLGLFHVCPITTTKLMEPFLATNFDGPQHDDIRGAQELYGDAYESNNSSATATPLGTLNAGATLNPSTVPAPAVSNGSRTSLINGDVDYFSFTTTGSLTVSATVTPVGLSYDNSTQNSSTGACNSGNVQNSLTYADLAVDIRDTNGTTILGSASGNGVGVAETVAGIVLPSAGTYFVRVYETNTPAETQLYTLTVTANGACVGAGIATQPTPSLSRCSGSSASFTVVASGSGPFTYQWRKGISNIAGATSATYTIPAVVGSDSGSYTCLVTNACGNATTNLSTLTVTDTINITTQPVTQAACAGSTVNFSVAATGTSPSYQWQRNSVDLVGENASTLSITGVTPADAGEYTCIVGNNCGNLTSDVALLTVNVGPSFGTNPAAQSICSGSGVTFTAAASGSPAPSLQWRKNAVNIPGATGTSYSIPAVNAGDAGSYDCVATNTCGSVPSTAALLTVTDAPVLSLQPSPVSACDGQPFSFSVAATTTVTYQWRKNTINIGGATSATFGGTANAGSAGSYDCVLTNSCGSTTSNAATLGVDSGPSINSQPVGASVASGTPLNLTVSATSSSALSYQWRRNTSNLSDAGPYSGTNSANLNIAAVTAAEAGNFDVVVSDDCGSLTSDVAAVSIATGCPADLDNGSGTGTPDGGVDINDLLYFLGQFEAGSAGADLDNGSGLGIPDGGVDINDLLYFLGHFEAGC